MNKLFNICLFAIGLTALNSCQKEVTPQEITSNDSGHYTISVDFAQTRVDLDKDLYSSWVEGDKIAVETESGFVPYELTSGAGSRNGVFTGGTAPKDGGYIVYPYDDYATGTYTFPAVLNYGSSNIASYPNGVSSDGSKFYSFVPMVGKMSYNASTKELKSSLRYASGAIRIKYSKLSQDAKGLEITMDQNIVGDASLTEKGGLKITGDNGSKTLTVKFNDESNGFPRGISFIVPVPEATYKSMSIRVTAKNGATVPGTAKSITKDFQVLAGHVVPFGTLEQTTPPYIFTEYTESTLKDGEYILVYDPNNTEKTVIINGDDGIRESMKAPLDEDWGAVQGGKTVVLDYADYLTGAWILKKQNNNWSISNPKAIENNETWTCEASKNNNGYWYLKVKIDGRTVFNPVHYYPYGSNAYRPTGGWDKTVTVGGTTYKVYEFGVFTDASETNIKLYKLKE